MVTFADIRVFVVSCAQDKERRATALASVAALGLSASWVKAVDARDGFDVLRPHKDLVRDTFWEATTIKPGALACFISHRLAWKAFLESEAACGIFMEDDSRLMTPPAAMDADIVFLNDRLLTWAESFDAKTVPDLMALLAKDGIPRGGRFAKAPGGDGYLLTREGAQRCLERSEVDGVRCGVDWYLSMLAGGCPPDGESCTEVAALRSMFGARGPTLTGAFAQTAHIENGRHWSSSLGHSHTLEIAALRAALA